MAGAPLASAPAVFDANGRAEVTLGPTVYGSRWNVDKMVVSTTSTMASKCDVYRDAESLSNKIDNTRTGNADTSETNIDLSPPSVLRFVWSGGTPGATATAVVYGTLFTGRG